MFSLRSIAHFLIHQFTFSLGGGIGEAALFGAAFGGAKSLVTGEDPLEGALLGGLSGGATSGLTSALLGNAGTTVAEAGLPALVEPGTEAAANLGSFAATDAGKELAAITTQSQLANAGITDAYNIVNPNATSMMENLPKVAGQGGYDAAFNAGQPYQNMVTGSTSVAPGVAEAEQARIAALPNTDISGGVTQGLGATESGLNWYNKPGFDIRKEMNIDPTSTTGKALNWAAKNQALTGAGLGAVYGMVTQEPPTVPALEKYKSKMAGYNPNDFTPYTPVPPTPAYRAQYAQGGIAALANNGMGNNQGYPQGVQDNTQYATPSQMPTSAEVINADYEPSTNPYSGSPIGMANGGIAGYSLGGYAAGGNPRLLKGPGDGMSDNIPATIGHKQPARLADGEFVVPADVVSHLGNGSTDAGAKHLYNMMDQVRKARTGTKKQGKQIKPEKFLPA